MILFINERILYERLTMSDGLNRFLVQNNIDPEDLSYEGRGDFGEAYSTSDDRILKKTSSKKEYELAKTLIGKAASFDSIAAIYAVDVIDGYYYIIMEELDVDSSIEDIYNQLDELLQSQGLSILETDYFDEDEYEENNGEIDSEIKEFMQEIYGILHDYRRLGVQSPDVKPDNMGRDRNGKLKAFDIDDKIR